jgi:hypothetical protein
VDKTEYINLEFLIFSEVPSSGSKYSWHFANFKDGWEIHKIGSIEEWVDVFPWSW